VGQHIILGTPWYQNISATINVGAKSFNFQETAWPVSEVLLPTIYKLSLWTKQELASWIIRKNGLKKIFDKRFAYITKSTIINSHSRCSRQMDGSGTISHISNHL
jgi:hypothetical protein